MLGNPTARSAAVVLLLLAASARSSAGELLRKLCGSPCAPAAHAQLIQLPAQNIVVETTPPRIRVSESKPDRRLRVAPLETPFVATILAPLPLVPAPASQPLGLTRDPGPDGLEFAHRVEQNLHQLERLRALHDAEVRATNRVFERVSGQLRQALTGRTDEDAVVNQLKALQEKMDRLEKIVSLHDDVLRKMVAPPPKEEKGKGKE